MALRWAAVRKTPGYYSAIVSDVVLVDHRVGCLSIPLRAECSNLSGSGSLLRQILVSTFVGGFVPLSVRVFLQIHCHGHIRCDPCLVVYGLYGVGSFHAAAAAVVSNIRVRWGYLATELRSHSHYSSYIEAVLVVDRHSARAVVYGSPN